MDSDVKRSDIVRNYFYRSYRVVRIWMLIALALYTLFGVLDDYLLPLSKYDVWIIRYLAAVPMMATLILFSFLIKENRKRFQLIVVLFVMVGTLGLCSMIAILKPDEKAFYLYFIGLLAIISWCQIIGFTHRLFVITAFVIMILYNLVAIFANQLHLVDPAVYIFNNMFFIVFMLFGFYSTRVSERFIIDDYQHARDLKLDKKLLLEKQNELAELSNFKTKLVSTIVREVHSYIPSIREIIKKANKEDNNLEQLDLLLETTILWSQKNSSVYPMSKQSFNLKMAIDEAFRSLTELAQRKKVVLINRIEEGTLINSDKKVLNIILRNMVNLALLKFELGKIIVSSNQRLNDIEILVSDEEVDWLSVHTALEGGQSYCIEENNDYNFGLRVSVELVQQHNGLLCKLGNEKEVKIYFSLAQEY